MNPLLKNTLVTVASLLIAGGLMYFAVKDVQTELIVKSFTDANYLWVGIASIFGLWAYWLRAVRWNYLLEPLGYRISNFNALWTVSFGYLLNLLIPRSGEIARATSLYSVEKVPVAKSFGTIVTERIVDFCFMLIFLGLTLISTPKSLLAFLDLASLEISSHENQANAPSFPWKWVILVSILFGMLILFAFKKTLRKFPLFNKLYSFLENFWKGLVSVFKIKNWKAFLLYSFGIWICYYLSVYVICYALESTSFLTFEDGFFLIVVGTIGMIIPASGGIGAFHAAMKVGFAALFFSLGKSADEGSVVGLSFAFLAHTMQMVIMLVMGLISIPMLSISRKKHSVKG